MLENQAALDQLVLRECKVMMALQVQRDHKVMLVLQECRVQMVPQDQKDTQDLEERQVKLVRTEDQDPWDHLGLLVHQVLPDSKAILACLALLVLLACHQRESPAPRVLPEFPVSEVTTVSQALLVLQVPPVHRERLSTTMRRACPSSLTRF